MIWNCGSARQNSIAISTVQFAMWSRNFRNIQLQTICVENSSLSAERSIPTGLTLKPYTHYLTTTDHSMRFFQESASQFCSPTTANVSVLSPNVISYIKTHLHRRFWQII